MKRHHDDAERILNCLTGNPQNDGVALGLALASFCMNLGGDEQGSKGCLTAIVADAQSYIERVSANRGRPQ